MKDSKEHTVTHSTAVEQACEKVVTLYNSGNNCDKAVLLAMQELLHIPPDHWDFSSFYSEKPEDSDRFLCKVLVAGAVSIYLDVLARSGIDSASTKPGEKTASNRVEQIFNRFISDCSGDAGIDPVAYDPFARDPEFEGLEIQDHIRQEYTDRVTTLANGFQTEFPGSDCVDILGFDPFAYADYDEDIQEEIESGEWMQQCIECMQYVITKVKASE